MDNVRIGSCSWKYPSWEGLVYSSPEPANYLEEYARKYRSVEVDQWFWSLGKGGAALPRRETVADYDAATPAEFRFTVKCPDALCLSHHRGRKGLPLLPNPRFLETDFFLRFLDALAPLVPKIGLFIFQFEYLNQEKMPERSAFLDRLGPFLDSLPADLPYAVELRNPRWIDASWFDFLRSRRTSPVLLQGYWMDDVPSLIERYRGRLGPGLCVRLHGEDREGMEEKTGEDWSRIVRPKDGELGRLVTALQRITGVDGLIFINVNNHYEGSAPLTMGKLEGLLGQAPAEG
jgi:uncharacterized protein YecE (DUF72 family)